MADTTKIEWADSTFNGWIGCTKVSPACDHCYAERSTPARSLDIHWGTGKPRFRTSEANWRKPLQWEREAQTFFDQHGRRRRVFTNSLSDVFDNEVDPQWRLDLSDLIRATPSLDWLVLTKRIGLVSSWIADYGSLPENVWLGISVVNQKEALRDIPKLQEIPVLVRFLSCEPLLGPIDLIQASDLRRLHWVIVGGESGADARPMHPEWVRSLRDQCASWRVPFLFKQWGEWVSVSEVEGHGVHFSFPDHATVRRVGKKNAGNMLGGVQYLEFP